MARMVWVKGKRLELGSTRYAVEWDTVKESSRGKEPDLFEPDLDSVSNVEYFDSLPAARRRAKAIYNREAWLTWGVVQINEEVVEWLMEEDGIGTWEHVKTVEEVS